MRAVPSGLFAQLLFLVCACASVTATQDDGPYVVYVTRGSYADVLEDVRQAIISRGLVISAASHVADMLDRTGKDLGNQKRVYGNGEVQLFCSALLSRQAMESDARNIVFCPYGIAVWTEVGNPGRVFVGFRRADTRGAPATVSALKEVEKLLDEIAREATRR